MQRSNATLRRKKIPDDEKTKKEKKKTTSVKEEEKNKSTVKKPATKRPPLTPPSSRVTKTQFFSSKSTASSTKVPLKNKTATKTEKTSSKNERPSVKEFIKKVREENKKKSLKNVEESVIKRPGTATLKEPVVLKKIEEPSTSDDYEDDFDSYESDFEVYTSESSEISEETNSSLSEKGKRVNSAEEEKKLDSGTFDLPELKHKQVLHNISENVECTLNPASLPDEGFEDVKSVGGDSGCFINFTNAQKKLRQNKQRKRGEEILSMIKLDSFTFTLFDLAPMSYERYIKLYGNQNCLQASSQTGDDNTDEDCQTEEIIKCDKWTQAPIKFSNFNDLSSYKQEFKGVGGDIATNKNLLENNYNYNKAAQLLLNLLQENNSYSLKELQNSDLNGFSTGYIECNTKTLLKNTFVTYISHNINDYSLFLTVHRQKERCDQKSLLCTWYLSNLNQPENIFICYNEITCCCFSYNDICAGSSDGTVSVWSGSSKRNQQLPDCVSNIGIGHINKIVSIHPIYNDETTNQLCTLDCDGNLIFWSILHNHLTLNNKITLNTCNDQTTNMLLINQLNSNHLFVATSTNYVIHTLLSNAKAYPKKYCATVASEVTCMAACPFSELYFLVGFKNGCVALYSRMTVKPLLLMVSKNVERKVDQIEWSHSRPCVFYVKHQDIVDVWDLMYSDMIPTLSVPFEKTLQCIKAMPTKDFNKSCMIVGYTNGELQLHVLNKEHSQNTTEGYKQDVKKFLNYVNRL